MSDSESELAVSSFKNAKKKKVDDKNATSKMNASSKTASDKLIKDEGKETSKNWSLAQRAAHKMRKNEIKEHIEKRSKEQRVSTLLCLYLVLWFSFFDTQACCLMLNRQVYRSFLNEMSVEMASWLIVNINVF